jgi:hypothetical protein
MSIQAVAWALEQDIPGTAKLVLVSLANHADHTNGHCWPAAETIAREASTSLRSVYRYVGALRRNGYVRALNRRGNDGKQRANDYWLLFDRASAAWNWAEAESEGSDDEPQDQATEAETDPSSSVHVDEPTANLAYGEFTGEPVDKSPPTATVAHGPTANGGTRQDSLEPSGVEPRARAAPPAGWRKEAFEEEEQNRAAEDARRKSAPVCVFVGTRAWDAWTTPRWGFKPHNPRLFSRYVIDGKLRVGWYFPTLFPPSGPDPPAALTPEESREVSNF